MTTSRVKCVEAGAVVLSCLSLGAFAAPPDLLAGSDPAPYPFDADRVAILAVEGAGLEAVQQAVLATGVQAESLDPWPIAGWFLLETPADARTLEGVKRLVEVLAADEAIAFVSPVFMDRLGGPLFLTPDIVVAFDARSGRDAAQRRLAGAGAPRILNAGWAGMAGIYRARTASANGFDVIDALAQLDRHNDVRWVEPDVIFTGRGSHIPNDPGFVECWGLYNTGQEGFVRRDCGSPLEWLPGTPGMDMAAPDAWDITTGDPSILVVIIDAGVQLDHPDLHLGPARDFTSDGGNGGPVNACDNHGTLVAGCVSAIIDNELGTVGVAPNCRSASARTFISRMECDASWTSQPSWTVDALDWAESISARVTNNSNVYGFTSFAIEERYASTRDDGIIHFAAAGNAGNTNVGYPARLPTVNAIASLNRLGNRACNSNYGPLLAFSAPGIDIYTTDRTGPDGLSPEDYFLASGTSFASPYAAGVAALILSQQPWLDAIMVEQILFRTCRDLGDPGFDPDFGWGFVDAHAALAAPEPILRLSGPACPAVITVEWGNAAPRRQAGLLFARNEGSFQISGGPCDGTRLGLGTNQLQLVRTFSTGVTGSGRMSGNAGAPACGGFLQIVVVDGSPCATSNVERIR